MNKYTKNYFFTKAELAILDSYSVKLNIFSTTHKTNITELNEIGVINLHLNLLPYKRFNQVHVQITGKPYAKTINLCPSADSCHKVCLETCGMNVFASAINAKYKKTKLYIEQRALFMKVLVYNIHNKAMSNINNTILVRLNTLSDIIYETIPFIIDNKIYMNIFDYFKSYDNVKFYDYTKIFNRNVKHIANYELIYSYNSNSNKYDIHDIFDKFNNVAVVFRSKLPKTFKGYGVINGDHSDYNTKYNKCIIGLLAKGKAIKDKSGFVQD